MEAIVLKVIIEGEFEQIEKLIPILKEMADAGAIWDRKGFITPFQYGDSTQEVALIKLTKSKNLMIYEMQSPE